MVEEMVTTIQQSVHVYSIKKLVRQEYAEFWSRLISISTKNSDPIAAY